MDNLKYFIYSFASVMTVYADFLGSKKSNSKNQINWWLSFKLLKNRRGNAWNLFLLLFPVPSKNISIYKLFTATYFCSRTLEENS